jgi:hypothetical protein
MIRLKLSLGRNPYGRPILRRSCVSVGWGRFDLDAELLSVYAAYFNVVSDFSDSEKQMLFRDTASAIYGV